MAKPKKVTWQEVRKHSKEGDGWIVIKGKVYDVTKYLPAHPGGPQWILDWLGKDATEAYVTKGGMGLEHSDFAKDLLKDMLIGEVTEATKNKK